MTITEVFIRKPVLSMVLSLLLLLIGVISYDKLSLRQYPRIDSSVISINTSYPGASAQTVESYVTSPIEGALSGIDGIDYISSSSTLGNSAVSIHFRLGFNMQEAAATLREKVAAVRYQIPNQANDPIITQADPNSNPVMYITYSSQNLSPLQVTDYLQHVVGPALENVDGVGQVNIMGALGYSMRIMLDPQRMAAHNITSEDIMNALGANQIHPPAGRIESSQEEYQVSAQTDVASAQAFNHLILRSQDGLVTRLEDVGKAMLAPDSVRSSFYLDNQRGLIIGVVPSSDGNPLAISKAVHQTLAELQNQYPGDLKGEVFLDNTLFIKASLHEVKKTIIEASLCVILVMFLFLGSFRMLSVPVITIPLSLIGICALLLAMGFSLNNMTLLAMVLAIGLVVDDAIVVSENIHRHIEKGLSPTEAAIKGSHEIQFAILSMTLTLAAVFIPIGFLSGLTGALFKEFAFALAGAVIISGVIALVLAPMMCSKVMNPQVLTTPLCLRVNAIFSRLSLFYEKILRNIIKVRLLIPLLLILGIFLDAHWYHALPQELAPQEDTGAILTVVSAPPNANIEYTEYYTQQVSDILKGLPEQSQVGIINGTSGVNSAMLILPLPPWEERGHRTTQIIANELNAKLSNIAGVQAFAMNPFALPGATSLSRVGFVLQSAGSFEQLYRAVDSITKRMHESGLFTNTNTNLKIDTPQISLEINRDMAGELGIPMSAIASAINIGLGNPTLTDFSMSGKRYNVVPGLASSFKSRPEDLYQLQVRSQSGALVPLANLVTIHEHTQAQSLEHFNQLRSATISAGLAPGYALGDATTFLKNAVASLNDSKIHYDFTGEIRQFLGANEAMTMTFVYALLFIFLLLSAQFESFISPLIVLCGLFFSIAGALGALYLAGYSSNIYTQIGLLTLIGLISKHGILIVEFANQLKSQGQPALEAVVCSAKTRLRPILMTTAAMVLGAVPLMLASGAGAMSRKQIGLVIVSGMSFGTFMTVLIVPCIYLLIEELKSQLSKRKKGVVDACSSRKQATPTTINK